MTRFRQWLRALLVFASNWPAPAKGAPEWLPENAASLSNYLQTPTGRKLYDTLRFQEAATNASAVLRNTRSEYACGFAAGNRACVSMLWSLSASVPLPNEHEIDPLSELTGAELIENLRS